MNKIILEPSDIETLEKKLNELPVFAKNVSENMLISNAVQDLVQWLSSKVVEVNEVEDTKIEKPKVVK